MKPYILLLQPGRDATLLHCHPDDLDQAIRLLRDPEGGILTVAQERMGSAQWICPLRVLRRTYKLRELVIAYPEGLPEPPPEYIAELVEDLSTRRAVQ